MAVKVPPRGSAHPDILIIGEAPGVNEEAQQQPFVGASGQELDRLLLEGQLNPYPTLYANVCNYRPPGNDISAWITRNKKLPSGWISYGTLGLHPHVAEGYEELLQLILDRRPKLILPLGNLALWAVTEKWGITNWRGSQLFPTGGLPPIPVVPTFHPAALFRQWEWRPLVVRDLRRAAGWMNGPVLTHPIRVATWNNCAEYLDDLIASLDREPTYIASDIETRRGLIACIGFATERHRAFCVPFMTAGFGRDVHRHSYEAEWEIRKRLRIIFTHPNLRLVGHNFSYDIQYIGRELGIWPRVTFDTIVAQHVLFAGMPKSLAFIASLYADHYVFWKEDGKYWDEKQPPETLWNYNCLDNMYTYECSVKLRRLIVEAGLTDVFDFQMNRLYPKVNRMALRGFRVHKKKKWEMSERLTETIHQGQEKLNFIVGRPLNIRSPVQMKKLFYEEFGFKPRISRATGNETVDDEALASIAEEEPIFRPLCGLIRGLRSANVFLSNFLAAHLDEDGRMRSSFSIVGTSTYRFASSESPYGTGLNMQNLPGEEVEIFPGIILPNIRELFVADENRTIVDVDLISADAQVVAALAKETSLLNSYSTGVDVHLANANSIWQLGLTPQQLQEGTPAHTLAKQAYAPYRRKAKAGVHATNYGASPARLAAALGIPLHEAHSFQDAWLSAYPGIRRWHAEVRESLITTRTLVNPFGYRRMFFGRLDNVFPEALAWIPQSTVACLINRILVNLEENYQPAELLVQVHDSLVFQVDANYGFPARDFFSIPVPFDPPLLIGTSAKAGPSWGETNHHLW